MWNIKNNINESINEIETDSQTQKTYGYQREGRGQTRCVGLKETNYCTDLYNNMDKSPGHHSDFILFFN